MMRRIIKILESNIYAMFLFAVILLLVSCSEKKIELPHGATLQTCNSKVKIKLNDIVFPSGVSCIMGFSLNEDYLYGWYNGTKGNVYFIFDLNSGKVQEGSFKQIKRSLLNYGLRMPNMSSELTYSLFHTKSEKELQKQFQNKSLGLRKTIYGYKIFIQKKGEGRSYRR